MDSEKDILDDDEEGDTKESNYSKFKTQNEIDPFDIEKIAPDFK